LQAAFAELQRLQNLLENESNFAQA
jgi:hypothetical protein